MFPRQGARKERPGGTGVLKEGLHCRVQSGGEALREGSAFGGAKLGRAQAEYMDATVCTQDTYNTHNQLSSGKTQSQTVSLL